jgi:hypothetical protein
MPIEVFDFGTSKVTTITDFDKPTVTVLYRLPPHAPYIFEKDGQPSRDLDSFLIENEALTPQANDGEFAYVNTETPT